MRTVERRLFKLEKYKKKIKQYTNKCLHPKEMVVGIDFHTKAREGAYALVIKNRLYIIFHLRVINCELMVCIP